MGQPDNAHRHGLRRSLLAVPGAKPDLFEKALNGDADRVFLDLEDAVTIADKAAARDHVIRGVRELDWAAAGKAITVRINALDTPFAEQDLREVLDAVADRLDTVMVPKVNGPGDLEAVDAALDRLGSRVGVEALIETALGLVNVEAIAQSSDRLEALHFGPGDFAASVQARTVSIGGTNPDYPGDQSHYALSRILVACRAFGLAAIDGAYDDFRDASGYTESAQRSAVLGFEGKWAIHPAQVQLANEVYAPAEDEVARARLVLAALEEAAADGRGAAQIDGRMIDAASARMAENIVRAADAIASRRA